MKKRVATIILNRNLPGVTDALYSHLFQYDIDYTDIYVIKLVHRQITCQLFLLGM